MAQTIQLRRGTAAEWTAANPILADGELGVETDTVFYKIGDGVTAWNALSYSSLRSLDTLTVALMEDQATPTPPAAGFLKMYAKSLGGRMLLRTIGPAGVATPLQPSFFQNQIVIVSTGLTTTVQTIGNTVTSVGTVSHPAPTEQYGYMANFVSAATAAATCGTGNATALWQRGTLPGGSGGFFFNTRLAFPDTTYDQTGASTGTRIFVGLTSGTMALSASSDDPAGHMAGFFRRHVNGAAQDTNWQFATKDGSVIDIVNTGLPFIAQKVFDFYVFCAPQGSTIYWRIDNVTDGTTAEGSTTTRLPQSLMRAGLQVGTVDAVARNVRMQRLYTESDR